MFSGVVNRMSKDILYKAKRVDNGEWVCGLPIYKNYIRVFTEHEYEDEDGRKIKYSTTKDYQVDPKTMCEFIGLTDKNKNNIFEHDIVDYEDCPASDYYRETIIINRGVIEFENGAFFVTNRETVEMDDLVYKGVMECSVVGNIFDNPELLEGEELDEASI